MNIISFIQRKKEIKRRRQHQRKIVFLEMYFSRLYAKRDAGKIEIPYFLKATQTVKDLIKRGLVDDVYKHIKQKGVA